METITLIGRLGKDPEKKVSPKGTHYTQFSFAVSKKRQGEEWVTWYKITLFENEFENIREYLKKGTQLIIVGELEKVRPYHSKKGEPKVELNIRPFSIKFAPFRSSLEGSENTL